MKKELKPSLNTEAKNYNHLAETALRRIRETQENQERLKILKSLAQVKDSWAVEVLLKALDDSSSKIVDFIIHELGQREDLDLDIIHRKLLKPPWFIKNRVLRILALRKNPISAEHIARVLDEPNTDVRKTAAQTLGEIGGDDARALLVRLTKDKNPFVRKSAEEALQKASDLKFI